jgi:uncharacterized oxidoreductase
MPRYNQQQLLDLSETILRHHGATDRESEIVGNHLVDANLAGHDSHGVIRLPQYIQDIDAGLIRPGEAHTLCTQTETTAVIDANGVFGQVAGHDATLLARDKARKQGLAAVTVRRSNHTGRLGTYGEMLAAENMVSLVMVNGGGRGQWVAPFGGRQRRLSTNPMVMAAPSPGHFPLLLDMSSCVAPEGKVRNYLQRGERVPAGWLVDADGHETTDPQALYTENPAALLPLGGSAGHKGFGLAVMIDVLAGALSGAGCSRPETASDQGSGHSGLLIIAIDVACFQTTSDFFGELEPLVRHLKSCPPAAGFTEVLVPGESEFRARQDRLEQGIDIPEETWSKITRVAPPRT